ncbi:hypothetical protein FTUN_2594 [Frigoriglobus tundricola]|uniref:Uncharacterized protein n=1 Tax=Frigoriglobus tundricola TaxID=2774151 RepID=A0A6M5YMC0_9BACT|nr:hypothetical protein FTUN_2594 [Frigoriglobus tundricola]
MTDRAANRHRDRRPLHRARAAFLGRAGTNSRCPGTTVPR